MGEGGDSIKIGILSLKSANIMIAIVMLASPFVVGVTVSQYDPWADINDDGKIDIYDVAYTARAFGSSGDPAKNVTITGYETITGDSDLIFLPGYGGDIVLINTRGYRKIALGIQGFGTSGIDIEISWVIEFSYLWDSFNFNGEIFKVYEVNGETLRIDIHNPSADTANVYINHYITA